MSVSSTRTDPAAGRSHHGRLVAALGMGGSFWVGIGGPVGRPAKSMCTVPVGLVPAGALQPCKAPPGATRCLQACAKPQASGKPTPANHTVWGLLPGHRGAPPSACKPKGVALPDHEAYRPVSQRGRLMNLLPVPSNAIKKGGGAGEGGEPGGGGGTTAGPACSPYADLHTGPESVYLEMLPDVSKLTL